MNMSDFEWATVAQYLSYIEMATDMVQVSTDAIYSFRVGKRGFPALERKKRVTKAVLEENRRVLCIWVDQKRGELSVNELVVLRSMYNTITGAIAIVSEHQSRAAELARFAQSSAFPQSPEEDENVDQLF